MPCFKTFPLCVEKVYEKAKNASLASLCLKNRQKNFKEIPLTERTPMDIRNTTLDDIAAEIGFSATLRLVAWFGDDGNMYVPHTVEQKQLLPTLIGMSAAKALSNRWPGEYVNVPRLTDYEVDTRRRAIAKMLDAGLSTRYISHILRIGERRVQQICREMEVVGLIQPMGPPKSVKNPEETLLSNWLSKIPPKKPRGG